MPPRDEEEARREAARILEEAGLERAMEQLAGGEPAPDARERAAVASAAPEPTGRERNPATDGPATPWRDVPGATATDGGGVTFPARPARTPPSLASMGDGPQPMARPATPVAPSAPMQAPAVVRDTPAPMRSGATSLGDPADVDDRALAAIASRTPPAPSQPLAGASPLPPSRAAALGSPVEPSTPEPSPVSKPPAVVKAGAGDFDIPGADDLQRARNEDIPRGILHRIANGLKMASGRGAPTRFDSNEDRVRAQQRQMLGDKRQMRADEQRTAQQQTETDLARQRLTQSDTQAAERTSLQRARMALEERNASRADLLAGAQAGRLGEQTATERAERERVTARRDPASEASDRAQENMRALLTAQRDQSRVAPLIERLDSMSAEDVERLQTTGPQWLRDMLHRRGGSGGGGGGGGGTQTREGVRAALVERIAGADATPEQQAAAEGQADALISSVGVRRAGQSLLTDTLSRGRAEEGAERTTARAGDQRTTADVQRLGSAMDSALGWRQAIRTARAVDPTLLRATFVSGAIPAGFTGPQVEAARSAVNNLRGTLAMLRSGAAVTEAEFERIRDEMGAASTSSPEVFLQWLQRQESNEGERAARIRARYSGDVVSAYDDNLARERAPGAPQRTTPPTASGGQRYRVTRGDSTTERALTDQQAARLRDAGITVEAL